MGLLYPVGYILAVIDDRAQAERAVQTLAESGVAEADIDLVDGAWFAQTMVDIKEHRTPVERVMAFLAVEEREFMQEYVAEGVEGHTIVIVHAEQPEIGERVARVLAEHGAREMRHYGRFLITDLRG